MNRILSARTILLLALAMASLGAAPVQAADSFPYCDGHLPLPSHMDTWLYHIQTPESVDRCLSSISFIEAWKGRWHIDDFYTPRARYQEYSTGPDLLVRGLNRELPSVSWRRLQGMGYAAPTELTGDYHIISVVKSGRMLKTSEFKDRWEIAQDFINAVGAELLARERTAQARAQELLAGKPMGLTEMQALREELKDIAKTKSDVASSRSFIAAVMRVQEKFRIFFEEELRRGQARRHEGFRRAAALPVFETAPGLFSGGGI